MTIGSPSRFAIESEITQVSEKLSQLALGFFVIHIMGQRYGIREPNATMIGASFNELSRRIDQKGSHTFPSAVNAGAEEVAFAFRKALYEDCEEEEQFFGMSRSQFRNAVYSSHLIWAPDGDEAFDDGSYVLQFDYDDKVRLLAFKSTPDFLYDRSTLRDLWLSREEFYGLLSDWRENFELDLRTRVP